ncbi:conserved hypothetical protein [Ricinus communis]|uniref:Mechanosensitive ion channel protein n=1 Tax=Ricinus communis TaxID=3988 RepID=B9S5G8_RICCO|nr:conserved hypothetical protein [Ricinus communis]
MDFPSLKKSFKSQSSYKQQHTRKLSADGSASSHPSSQEELPILGHHYQLNNHDHHATPQPSNVGSFDRAEVIVKVDAGSSSSERSSTASNISKTRREASVSYMQHGHQEIEDPPSVLIGEFLNKQKIAGGEISLDMELEMDELRRELHDRNLPPFPESPLDSSINLSKEIRVSFDPSLSGGVEGSSESIRRRYKDLQEGKDDMLFSDTHRHNQQSSPDEVLRCTSSASFRVQPSSKISRLKTKSRLLDPPPEERGRISGRLPTKSGPLKSGLLGRAMGDDDDDDPLDDDDMPEEYKKRSGLSAMTVIQWVSLIAIVGALVCSLSISALKEESFLELKLWKWEVLLLVLICGRLVSGWGIRIIVFFIERNFLLRKRVLYFVYGLRSGVQNCWWLGLVLLAWHFLFDEKVERETKGSFLKYVTKILVCFLVANFVWLLKTLMVKVLASSFHVSTYFDRIQESIFNQYIIETLSGPPLIEIRRNEDEVEKTAAEIRKLQNAGLNMPPELKAAVLQPAKSERGVLSGGVHKSYRGKSFKYSRQLSKKEEKKTEYGVTIDYLHKLNPKNISAWNMKRLMKIVKYGSLSTLDEQILGAGADDESATEIRSEYEAKAAARKIFHNVARHGSKYIYLQDLMRFMRDDEALKTMSFFEGASEHGRISKSSLKNWVVNAFRERRALALTLNDTKTAVNKLHQVINVVGIVTIYSKLFIYFNNCNPTFKLVIVCHITFANIEEMNILTTIFLRADNMKIVYPNSVLATKPIGNFYRSPDMGDAVEFFIHVSTPAEKIAIMKQRITSFIEGKKEHWYPGPVIVMKELEDLNKVRVAVWMRHRINYQDMGERYVRRSLLLEEMVKIFKDLDIQYRLFPLDINIRTMPPLNSCSPP